MFRGFAICVTLFFVGLNLMHSQPWEGLNDRIYFPGPTMAHPEPEILQPTKCGVSSATKYVRDRILGGETVSLGEFPWMALLQYRTPSGEPKTACAGILINNRNVLTAGHCVKRTGSSATWVLESARLGEHNTKERIDCQNTECADESVSVSIESEIVHDKYDPKSSKYLNDIALLRLSRQVNFTKYIQPICLPVDLKYAATLTIAGWGKTGYFNGSSENLLKAEVPLFELSDCQKLFWSKGKRLISYNQLCAGGNGDADTCKGDSGGPLMQYRITNDGIWQWSVVGISSYGTLYCGVKGWPSIYTDVFSYVPWINDNMQL